MSWRDWPSWLKGGIIGLVVLFFLYLVAFLVKDTSIFIIIYVILVFPLVIFSFLKPRSFWFNISESLVHGEFAFPTLFGFVYLIILYFLIGALIGWIVGKIKKKE